MVKLRTTINPREELDVPPSEAADLNAMGLVLDMTKTRATTEEGLVQAAVRQVAGVADDTDPDAGAAGDNDGQEG